MLPPDYGRIARLSSYFHALIETLAIAFFGHAGGGVRRIATGLTGGAQCPPGVDLPLLDPSRACRSPRQVSPTVTWLTSMPSLNSSLVDAGARAPERVGKAQRADQAANPSVVEGLLEFSSIARSDQWGMLVQSQRGTGWRSVNKFSGCSLVSRPHHHGAAPSCCASLVSSSGSRTMPS